MKSKNLWGDLKDLKITPTPRIHLKEQAGNLAKLTDGILKGEINKGGSYVGGEFSYTIDIIAPYLNNYKKTILEIAHDIDPYPLSVYDCVHDKQYKCDNESKFVVVLEKILSSPEVHNIIESLISHSK